MKKLPSLNEITTVYAVIASLIYGWTILVFIWKLPAWIKFLTVGEVLGIFSYSMATNFLESFFLLGFILTLALLLPRQFLRDVFVLRGTILVASLLAALMLLLALYPYFREFLFGSFPGWILVGLLVSGAGIWLDKLARHSPAVEARLASISDRLIIFLYVTLPLSFIAVVILLFRNLG